jgi:amino acid transporter
MGSFGAAFIAVGALVSILGNLNGGFLAASRIPYAMSEQRELPQIIGRTHERFKTPYVSLFLTALAMLFLTIQSSFITAVAIATITRLLVYATTCASLPFSGEKTTHRSEIHRAFRNRGGGYISAFNRLAFNER